ncbi:MAG: hypothetical protein V8R03_06780 [Clostridium sp.]
MKNFHLIYIYISHKVYNKIKKQIKERLLSYDALIKILSNKKIYISKNTIEKIPVVNESIKTSGRTIASLPMELMVKDRFNNNIIENDIRLFILNI